MKIDLQKTNFLIEADGSIRYFRRKNVHMLFGADGAPIRPIDIMEWRKLRPDYRAPHPDGLWADHVWTLEEYTPK